MIPAGFGEAVLREPDLLVLEAPPDAGFLVDEIARRLGEQDYEVATVHSAGERPNASRRLVVPSPEDGTFTDAVAAGRQQELIFRNSNEGPGADFDRVRVMRAVYSVVADQAVVANAEEPPSPEAFERVAAMPRTLELEVRSAGRRREPPVGFAQAVPGTLVMFTMLVLLTSGAVLLVVERRQGLLRRLASTPISRGSVVAGKWGGKQALALVQVAFGMAVGTMLFRVDWGGSVPAVAAVLALSAGLNASLAMLLGSLARSEGQAAGAGVLSSMVLAALGGCWWPIEVAPAWMQKLALFLPTGWTMDALHRLVSFGEPWTAVVPHAAALAAAAVVTGWLSGTLVQISVSLAIEPEVRAESL